MEEKSLSHQTDNCLPSKMMFSCSNSEPPSHDDCTKTENFVCMKENTLKKSQTPNIRQQSLFSSHSDVPKITPGIPNSKIGTRKLFAPFRPVMDSSVHKALSPSDFKVLTGYEVSKSEMRPSTSDMCMDFEMEDDFPEGYFDAAFEDLDAAEIKPANEDLEKNILLDNELNFPDLNEFIHEMFETEFDEKEDSEMKTFVNNKNDENKKKVDQNKRISDNLDHETKRFKIQEDSCHKENSLSVDGTLELTTYKIVPLLEEFALPIFEDITHKVISEKQSSIELIHSLHESVSNLMIIFFESVCFVLVQHQTQINLWQEEKQSKGFRKIFSHAIETNKKLQQVCNIKSHHHLAIVLHLKEEQHQALQLIVFEKGRKIVKLMEPLYWLLNSPTLLMCSVQGMGLATAQGTFVRQHVLDLPRLKTSSLKEASHSLHSLCPLHKTPHTLVGISEHHFYVWRECDLVTSVRLHPMQFLPKCFWATIESDVAFLMTLCDKGMNQLVAVNISTGFCQIAITYSSNFISKSHAAVYCEPFLLACGREGVALWCGTDSQCSAHLPSQSATAIAVEKDMEDGRTRIALGHNDGCVFVYALTGSSS